MPYPPPPTPIPITPTVDFSASSANWPARVDFQEREGLPGYPLVQVTQSPQGIAYVQWLADGAYLEIGVVTEYGGGGPGTLCISTVLVDMATRTAWPIRNQSCFYGWTSKNILYRRAASPDGMVLALAEEGGVWIVNVLTREKTWIPIDCGPTVCPAMAFSPDGARLAITSREGIHILDPVSGDQIYLQPVEGQFLHDVGWSPDGKKLAYYDDWREDCSKCWEGDDCLSPVGSFRGTILDIEAKTVKHSPLMETWLTDCIGEAFYIFAPQWLLEGEQLLLPTVGGGLWIWDLESDNQTTISEAQAVNYSGVIVSPDRKLVALIQERKVYLYDAATGHTVSTDWTAYDLSWSPSGNTFALLIDNKGPSQGEPAWEGLLVRPETGELIASLPQMLAYTGDLPLSWSPTGHSIAYVSDHTLWLIDPQGQNPHQIVPDRYRIDDDSPWLKDLRAQWSPSGTQLAFLATTDKHGYDLEVYVVEVEGGD
jgi:Tol biopolymer transport system component